MSIPKSCRRDFTPGRAIRFHRRRAEPRAIRRVRRLGTPLLLLLLMTLVDGCGYTQGQLLYLFGFGRGKKVEASFRLTEEPLLILLDDPHGRLDWPPARARFFDELSQSLIKNKAAKKIIPRQTLEGLRQSTPEFEKRGCREIGEMAGADQVLWVQVQAFLADEQFSDTSEAAYFTSMVKVIDVKETRGARARLWPETPAGHRVHVSMTGADVAFEKTKAAISAKLATRLANRIAKIFYDHRLNDFGHEE